MSPAGSNPSRGCCPCAGLRCSFQLVVTRRATVNGRALSSAEFDLLTRNVAGKKAAELNAEQRAQALDVLVRAEVAAQQGEKDGLDKQSDTITLLALTRQQIMEQALRINYLKDRKATDAELKAEYDRQVAALPKMQDRARHILLKTKEDADKTIAQLSKGAKFETLTALQPIGGSNANGGDPGPVSFADKLKTPGRAAAGLKKGPGTPAPVATQYGWRGPRLPRTLGDGPA